MKRVSAPAKAALAAVNVIQERLRTEKSPRRVISPRSGARRRIFPGSSREGSATGGLGSTASVMGRWWNRHEFGGAGLPWQARSDNSDLRPGFEGRHAGLAHEEVVVLLRDALDLGAILGPVEASQGPDRGDPRLADAACLRELGAVPAVLGRVDGRVEEIAQDGSPGRIAAHRQRERGVGSDLEDR